MAGEIASAWHEPSVTQPGGRPPAPGELALVQAFINSHFDLEFTWGADLLATPRSLARWLERRALLAAGRELTRHDVRRAIALREGLRELARGSPTALNHAASGIPVELRFTAAEPHLVAGAASGLDHALAVILSVTASAMIDGSWTRLKVCPGEHCGWAFYDSSRNRSGRWCSMSVCGGRAKARAHYRRRHAGAD